FFVERLAPVLVLVVFFFVVAIIWLLKVRRPGSALRSPWGALGGEHCTRCSFNAVPCSFKRFLQRDAMFFTGNLVCQREAPSSIRFVRRSATPPRSGRIEAILAQVRQGESGARRAFRAEKISRAHAPRELLRGAQRRAPR